MIITFFMVGKSLYDQPWAHVDENSEKEDSWKSDIYHRQCLLVWSFRVKVLVSNTMIFTVTVRMIMKLNRLYSIKLRGRKYFLIVLWSNRWRCRAVTSSPDLTLCKAPHDARAAEHMEERGRTLSSLANVARGAQNIGKWRTFQIWKVDWPALGFLHGKILFYCCV